MIAPSAARAEDDGGYTPPSTKSRSLSDLEGLSGRAPADRFGRAEGDWSSSPPRKMKAKSKVQRVAAESPTPPDDVDAPARASIEDDLREPPRPYDSDSVAVERRSPVKNAGGRKPASARVQLTQGKSDDADAKKDKSKDKDKDADKEKDEFDDSKDSKDSKEKTPPKKTGTTSPTQLKKVTAILPFADYEPDPEIASKDPCRNQCPRPGHCKPSDAHLCPEELWDGGPYLGRTFEPSCFTWAASNLWYNPLYFEDVALERYGHTHCALLQPAVSVGRFGAQLVTLPYHMGIDPLCKKEYALGYYRPGDCAPKLCYQPPLSLRGGLVQAGVTTGLFFLIP